MDDGTPTVIQEFAILAMHPRYGVRLLRRTALDAALAGAVLAELVAARRVDLVDGAVTATDVTPTGSAVADATLTVVAAQAGRRPAWWIGRIRSPRLWDEVRAELVTDGLAVRRRGSLARLLHGRYRLTDLTVGHEITGRVRAVLDGTEPDERTALLAALCVASGLSTRIAPGAPRGRGHELLRRHWVARAVCAAIGTADSELVTTLGGAA